MLVEWRSLLDNIVLHDYVVDTWYWKLGLTQGYSVKEVYKLLTYDDQQVEASFTNIIWNKTVSIQVSLLAWRLMNIRLQTKDNLARRRILQPGWLLCSTEFGQEELVSHLCLEGTFFFFFGIFVLLFCNGRRYWVCFRLIWDHMLPNLGDLML